MPPSGGVPEADVAEGETEGLGCKDSELKDDIVVPEVERSDVASSEDVVACEEIVSWSIDAALDEDAECPVFADDTAPWACTVTVTCCGDTLFWEEGVGEVVEVLSLGGEGI